MEETRNAIAIAASLAAGIVANFGAMTETAACRAHRDRRAGRSPGQSGFTGSPDAPEHPAGFMRAHSPSGTPEVDRGSWQLSREWRLPKYGVNIKRYPMCYATHRSIDAMLNLVHDRDLAPDAVGEVHVRIGSTQRMMLRNHNPKTALEAKFSLEFAMASAMVARRVGLAELDDAFVRRTDVIENMRKVKCTTTDETLPDMPFAPEDKLSIVLKSGETITHPPVAPQGSWQKPLNDMNCATSSSIAQSASASKAPMQHSGTSMGSSASQACGSYRWWRGSDPRNPATNPTCRSRAPHQAAPPNPRAPAARPDSG
jgi:2-methylcitrate dehydratase PrpD